MSATDPPGEPSPTDEPRISRRRLLISIGVVVGLVAFFIPIWMSVHLELPDPADRLVQADTARAVAAIQRDPTAGTGFSNERCAGRLLGRDGADLLLHVECRSRSGGGSSAPYRVNADGTIVQAQDGSGFGDSVKKMFGDRLGNWYLNHQGSFAYLGERLKSAPTTVAP